MLYNPSWGKIYTTKNFHAWLKTKPRNKKYNYCDPYDCAVGQYLQHQGIEDYSLEPERLKEIGWHAIVFPYSTRSDYNTFGRARIRAAVACFSPSLLSVLIAFKIL